MPGCPVGPAHGALTRHPVRLSCPVVAGPIVCRPAPRVALPWPGQLLPLLCGTGVTSGEPTALLLMQTLPGAVQVAWLLRTPLSTPPPAHAASRIPPLPCRQHHPLYAAPGGAAAADVSGGQSHREHGAGEQVRGRWVSSRFFPAGAGRLLGRARWASGSVWVKLSKTFYVYFQIQGPAGGRPA